MRADVPAHVSTLMDRDELLEWPPAAATWTPRQAQDFFDSQGMICPNDDASSTAQLLVAAADKSDKDVQATMWLPQHKPSTSNNIVGGETPDPEPEVRFELLRTDSQEYHSNFSDSRSNQVKMSSATQQNTAADSEVTPAAIAAMAEYLGIDARTEWDLLWIARDCLVEPLPDGWQVRLTCIG